MTKKDGTRIRKMLKVKGIRIAELAEKWGKTKWTIYGILYNRFKSKDIEGKLRKLGGL